MLIRYSVENFKSFNERVEFVMIPGKGSLKKNHINPKVKGISTLKTSVIFGANASGKSNLIKAMAFGKGMIMSSRYKDQSIVYPKFKLSEVALQGNSRMEYEIQVGEKNYAYGFVFNEKVIVEEWLYEITNRGEKMLYSRVATSNFDIEPLLKKNKKKEHQHFLEVMAKSTLDNQLFLTEVYNRNVKENVENVEDLVKVYEWFKNQLVIMLPNDKYKLEMRSELVDNDKMQDVFGALLKYFDTGISRICLRRVEQSKVDIPNYVLEKIKVDLSQQGQSVKRGLMVDNSNNTYFITLQGEELLFEKVMTVHNAEGKDVNFETMDESDGTNRMMDYIPVMMDIYQGDKVFIIDEMERSLHPNLMTELFYLYMTLTEGKNNQLIVTTHESSMLDLKLLRRDEIWFVRKNLKGASEVYSLEEYKKSVRFDKEIRLDYLLGRYKGVPRMGDIEEVKEALLKNKNVELN